MTNHTDWFDKDDCSVAKTLAVIGERWTMLVIREAFSGTRRFDDFQRAIGVARNILSARLQTLVHHGVLERRAYSERPPRYEYRLTQKGIDLYPALVALMAWGDKYENAELGAPVQLIHSACGHATTPVMACAHCGQQVDARAMRAVPGPGARKRA